MKTDAERLISRIEFAERLNCSLRKLDRMHYTHTDLPKRIKLGRSCKYRAGEVDAFIRRLAESN